MKRDRDKYLVRDEFKRLLAAARTRGPWSKRDRNHLLLCLAGNLGLRVSEVLALTLDDFELSKMSRPTVRIATAKRRKPVVDEMVLDGRLAQLVRTYEDGLIRRARDYRPARVLHAIPLFPGRDPFHPISPRAAQLIFKRCAKAAGLNPNYTFHSLRHYRGCEIFAETKDLMAVKRLLRHASVSSSGVYVHMTKEEEERLVSKIGAVI